MAQAGRVGCGSAAGRGWDNEANVVGLARRRLLPASEAAERGVSGPGAERHHAGQRRGGGHKE